MGAVGTTNQSNRDDWVKISLEKLTAGWRILDAGAGEQPYRKHCQHLIYVSQDFAQYDPMQNSTGLQMASWDYGKLDIVSEITSIPEPDGSFDAILCTEVLEHVPDPIRAIDELSRLVKPGGVLLLTSPFTSMTHFAPFHFCSGFNKYFYLHHLARNGFGDIQIEANGNYYEFLAQELRRLPSVIANNDVNSSDSSKKIKIFLANMISRPLLRLLDKLSKKDDKTFEMQAFGLHVKAIRRKVSVSDTTSQKVD